MDDELIDVTTGEQVKNLLRAEEILGDRLVARVLRVVWDEETDEAFLWSINACAGCAEELHEGSEGFIWARPLGDDPESQHVSLQTYCSEDCVTKTINEWADKLERDLWIGYFTL